jgi:hypothetical protein
MGTYRTLVLGPGQCGVIRKNVRIVSVVTTGSGIAESSCNNLPDSVATKCWNYEYAGRMSNPDSSYFTANMWSYVFGGIEYELPTVLQTFDVVNSYFGSGTPTISTISTDTKAALKDAGVIDVDANGCFDSTGQDSVASILQLTLPENIEPGYIKIKSTNSLGEDQFYLIIPYESADCSMPCDA